MLAAVKIDDFDERQIFEKDAFEKMVFDVTAKNL